MFFNILSSGVSYWFRDHGDRLTDRSLRSLETVELEIEPDGYGVIVFHDRSREVAVLCNPDCRSMDYQNSNVVKCRIQLSPKKYMSSDGYDNIIDYDGKDICKFSLNKYIDIYYHIDQDIFNNILSSINFDHENMNLSVFFKVGYDGSKLRHGSRTDTILWDISMNEDVIPTGVNLNFWRKHTSKSPGV